MTIGPKALSTEAIPLQGGPDAVLPAKPNRLSGFKKIIAVSLCGTAGLGYFLLPATPRLLKNPPSVRKPMAQQIPEDDPSYRRPALCVSEKDGRFIKTMPGGKADLCKKYVDINALLDRAESGGNKEIRILFGSDQLLSIDVAELKELRDYTRRIHRYKYTAIEPRLYLEVGDKINAAASQSLSSNLHDPSQWLINNAATFRTAALTRLDLKHVKAIAAHELAHIELRHGLDPENSLSHRRELEANADAWTARTGCEPETLAEMLAIVEHQPENEHERTRWADKIAPYLPERIGNSLKELDVWFDPDADHPTHRSRIAALEAMRKNGEMPNPCINPETFPVPTAKRSR